MENQIQMVDAIVLRHYGVLSATNTALIDSYVIGFADGSMSELFTSGSSSAYRVTDFIVDSNKVVCRFDDQEDPNNVCNLLKKKYKNALGYDDTEFRNHCRGIETLDPGSYVHTPGTLSLWDGSYDNDGNLNYTSNNSSCGSGCFLYRFNILIEAPITEYQGVFVGWFEDAEYTRPISFPFVLTGGTHVYAYFGTEYTVKFETFQGTVVADMSVVDRIYEDEIPTISKPGYIFDGWYLDSGCTTAAFTNYQVMNVKPADWETSFNNYYQYVNGVYVRLALSEAPTWQEGTYYRAYYAITRPNIVLYAKWRVE